MIFYWVFWTGKGNESHQHKGEKRLFFLHSFVDLNIIFGFIRSSYRTGFDAYAAYMVSHREKVNGV